MHAALNQLRTLLKITLVGLAILIAVLAASMIGHAAKRHPRMHPARMIAHASSHIHTERSANEQALLKLQQEIAKYESELRDHEKREQRSKKNIKVFEQRTASLKATIARLESLAAELQSSKTEVDRSLHVTSNTLDTLKDAYARSSRQLYMQNALTPLDANNMLISPSASDPIRMSYYAEVIARAHAMSRTRLDSMKQSLAESSHELASTIETEHQQIGEHRSEASTLEEKKAEEAKQLAQIQAHKAYLLKLLAERKASEKRLEGIIANLVVRENSARHAERRHGAAPSKKFESEASLGPARGPHSLEWPSAGHHILEGFGEHRNAEFNTVTMNLGIDISVAQGSPVRAAAEGEVALVSSLPSYGTIVVLRHSGGLHTVYANLSSASVHPGQHINAGATVGKSGINDESTALIHFEVWSGKSRQNPLGWLK